MKVLIIEDEPDLANGIKQFLEELSFRCEIAGNYDHAMEYISLYEYDCILIDIGLPDGNGLELIHQVKAHRANTGIIIISARHALEDRLRGLDLGADDYLSKPFHLSELSSRIHAVIRRRQFDGELTIHFHEISVEPDKRQVFVGNTLVSCTPSEFQLLLYFLANPGRVLSKESIAEHLIGEEADHLNNYDFIYSHVKNLRKKLLARGAKDYIQAVYGIGYTFSEL